MYNKFTANQFKDRIIQGGDNSIMWLLQSLRKTPGYQEVTILESQEAQIEKMYLLVISKMYSRFQLNMLTDKCSD